MKTMYQVVNYPAGVLECEVVKDTEHTVWVQMEYGDTRMYRKAGVFFDSFEQAKDAIVQDRRAKVRAAEEALRYAEEKMAKALAIHAPIQR